MSLPARAENVALVRHAIAGSAEAMGMDGAAVNDLKTVVTEACMNVVQHAYDAEGGPLEVSAWPEGEELAVLVSDSGQGIRPRADSNGQSLKLGLSLIASMTSAFEIAGEAGSGTRVTMRLPFDAGQVPEGDGRGERPAFPPEAISLTAWDTGVLGPILSRVVGALAARGEMGVDRLSDVVLFGDALGGDLARVAPDDGVRVRLEEGEDGLVLRAGPLAEGGADTLREGLELPGGESGSLEALAEEVRIDRDGEGEYLVARFAARSG